jgi:predicted phosphodiesterase
MRILHISDLHVDPPWTSLRHVWGSVDSCLLEDKFDFIVVSGDLSRGASVEEYQALHELAEGELLKRLHDSNRARIVFVPGNHDVRWDDVGFRAVSLDDKVALCSARDNPDNAVHRVKVTDNGHVQLFEINEREYPKRLQAVQSFLDGFYSDPLSTKHVRKFALQQPGDDWSCHQFLDQGVAFVGLNSCDGNDKYWHGARLHADALENARRFVRQLRIKAPELVVIAVWHHGFSSSAARPDRLTLTDVGRVFNMGANLGLHGHTHLGDAQHYELLDERMPVIAAGSLAAGGGQLPAGTPNEFCILNVDSRRVMVENVRLNHRTERYLRDKHKVVYSLARREQLDARNEPVSSCRVHRRIYDINRDGIKHVTVDMTELDPVGEVPLALVAPPYCAVVSGGLVQFARTRLDPLEKRLPDGKHRYSLPSLKSKKGSLSWSYDVSNSVALTSEELTLLPRRLPTYPHLSGDEDACAFVVSFGCELLELQARFESAPPLDGARVLVERHLNNGSEVEWEPDDGETERATKGFTFNRDDKQQNVLVLRLEHPLIGYRYSLVFKPGSDGRALSAEAKHLARTVLEACRGTRYDLGQLRADLTHAIDAAINDQLGGEIGEWVAHLWQADDHALLAAFGPFASQAWSSYFEAGTGVCGHAFRHGAVVGWCRGVPGMTETIYRPALNVPGARGPDYQWVLCFPLLVSAEGPAIGVVGLARVQSRSPSEQLCESYVRALARGSRPPELNALHVSITAAFWTVLATSLALPEPQRRYAHSRLAELQRASVPPPPPPGAL